MTDEHASLASRLIRTQRTLVLATAAPEPWPAPVYYLWQDGRFHFFSSPRSRHVTDALATGRCAAAIFRDSDEWRRIEGLQMEGVLEAVPMDAHGAGIFRAYVRRFPTVESFFGGAPFDLAQFAERFRSRLYAFVPRRVFYLNNEAGLGTRREIRLPD